MNTNNPRFVRIAKQLMAEKKVVVPKSVFDDVISNLSSVDGINIVSKRPHRGCFEVNGLMKNIRKIVKRMRRKYKDKFKIDIDNKSANERKRCLVEIRPVLPSIPDRAKAQYQGDNARFIDGPYKGEEVIWSSRGDEDSIPDKNEMGDDIFIVEPDRYRATFYGWKKKY